MPAISNKVVIVAVYPDLSKKQIDGDMVIRRVNQFVDAVRQVCALHEVCRFFRAVIPPKHYAAPLSTIPVALLVETDSFDERMASSSSTARQARDGACAPTYESVLAKIRTAHANVRSFFASPAKPSVVSLKKHLSISAAMEKAQLTILPGVDPEEYCRKLTDIYERHTKRIQLLEVKFKRFYSMAALHEEFATATKRPVSTFRKIWRRRRDCPNDCRGLLHL